MGTLAGAVRRGLFRALGGAAARLEPRDDAGHMTRQFERGELVWRAFVDAGAALRRSGRFDEADAMVARGLVVFPGDPSLLYEHAFAAHSAGRYETAITRWEAALAAAPDQPMCHAGVAANLRETGALERAARVIDAALARFPADLTVITEAARIADRTMRFDQSLPLWRRAAAAAEPAPEWLQGEIHALLRLGRFAEAEAALAVAKTRVAQHPGLMAVEGILASEQDDWTRALAIWSAYRRLFPDDTTGRDQYELARRRATARNTTRLQARPIDDAARAALLSRFTSLGDDGELALLQQRHEVARATPLLWKHGTFDGLLSALTAAFAGLGEPAYTTVTAAANGDVVVTDERWHLSWVALAADMAPLDRTADAMGRLLAATAADLLAGFAAAERVVVYRSQALDGDRLDALHRALLRFGPVRLLNVQPAAPTAPTEFSGSAGDLVEIEPGRYVGFLERRGDDEIGEATRDDWAALCLAVEAAADRSPRASPPSLP